MIININKYNHSYDHIAQFKVVLRFIVLRATACIFHGHYTIKSGFEVRWGGGGVTVFRCVKYQ